MFDSYRYSSFFHRYCLIGSMLVVAGCSAQPESHVVVDCTLDEQVAMPILDAFERSTDHEVGVVSEFADDLPDPDEIEDMVWSDGVISVVLLQQAGLLQPHSWQVDAAYPRELMASDQTWCGIAAIARVLIVNTERLSDPDQYPQSVAELADPRWAGQCLMARPTSGSTATHFAVLRARQGDPATLEQLQAIRANAEILDDNRQVALAVSSGKWAWGLTDSDRAIVLRDAGYPVAIVYPDQAPDQPGTLRIPNTIAIMKKASHPVASGWLADYLVSAETEDRLAMGNRSQLPISRGSKFPPRVLPGFPVRWMRADFEAAASDWQSWTERVEAIFD